MSAPSSLTRRLVLTATTVALTAGLSAGVASAETTGSLTSSSSGASSWTDVKRAASDIAGCKLNTKLPWCRNR